MGLDSSFFFGGLVGFYMRLGKGRCGVFCCCDTHRVKGWAVGFYGGKGRWEWRNLRFGCIENRTRQKKKKQGIGVYIGGGIAEFR